MKNSFRSRPIPEKLFVTTMKAFPLYNRKAKFPKTELFKNTSKLERFLEALVGTGAVKDVGKESSRIEAHLFIIFNEDGVRLLCASISNHLSQYMVSSAVYGEN